MMLYAKDTQFSRNYFLGFNPELYLSLFNPASLEGQIDPRKMEEGQS